MRRAHYAVAMNLPERVLRQSRMKWVAVLLACTFPLTSGLTMRHESPVTGWSMIVLFGLGVIVSGVALLPSSGYLRLTPDGFGQRVLFRTSLESWRHIDHFESAAGSVGVVYEPDYAPAANLRKTNRSLLGVDGVLADTYGMKADALAALMNDWLRKYKDPSLT